MAAKRIIILLLTIAIFGGFLFYLYNLSGATPDFSFAPPVAPPLPAPPPPPVPPPSPLPSATTSPPQISLPIPTPEYPPLVFEGPPPVARGAALSFSPLNYSGEAGKAFSVDVFVDTAGQNVVALSAVIKYDDTLLGVTDIETENSVFPIEAERLNYSGTLQLSRGKVAPGFTGEQGLFARIHFTPKLKGSGELKFEWEGVGGGPSRVIVNDGKGTDILTNVLSARLNIF